jgi:predicted nucleotidyltransferase
MKTIIQNIIKKIIDEYKQDKNVLGIMLFGSVARNKFDEYSDVDIYVLLKNKKRFSRKNFESNGLRVDIILDTLKEAKNYLKEDKNNVRRNTSHMLAHGKILFQRTKDLEKIQRAAENNLGLKTKYRKDEILMHKYSIDDFWGEVQRDIKNKDYLAFGLDSQLLMNNILELFLKINKTFFRQPNEMMKILKKIDAKFAKAITNFYKEKDIKRKKRILKFLVKYIYAKSGGPMPKIWTIK